MRPSRIAAALFLLVGSLAVRPQDQGEPDIPQLLRDLDDDKLEVREKAERALIEVGKPALEDLRKAAESGSAEVRARARNAARKIKTRLGLWEFDPRKEIEKDLPATLTFGTTTAKFDGAIAEIASPDLTRLLPGWRFYEATYSAEGDRWPVLAAIDISRESQVLGRVDLEHAERPALLAKIFLDADMVAKTDEGRRAVARIWVHLCSSVDLVAQGRWWGALETKPIDGGGFRVEVTQTHGKTGSWTDVYTLTFGGSGALTGADYRAEFH